MKSYRLLTACAAAMAVTAMLTSCGGSADKAKDSADSANLANEVIDKVAEAPAVTTITANGKLIVLDFNASWCGPCRQFAPNFESVADKYRGQASFYSIDVDQNPRLAAQFNIQSIPTVVYIQPDGTTSSTMGYMDAAAFDTAVSSRLN